MEKLNELMPNIFETKRLNTDSFINSSFKSYLSDKYDYISNNIIILIY